MSKHQIIYLHPTSEKASSGTLLWRRLSTAVNVLLHGEGVSHRDAKVLDPRIVASIDRQAQRIAEDFGDPLVGSFARDILTDSAHMIVDSFDAAPEEARADAGEVSLNATLLIDPPRKRP